MALFLSTYVNKIDKKGRISVPAQFRAVLTNQNFSGIVAYPSFVHDCIEACGMDRLEKLSDSIDAMDPYSDERDAFAASILGDAMQLSFDADGRITLPEKLIDMAGLSEKTVFVGKGQTFEMWEPERFDAYQVKARELAKTHRGSLRLRKQEGEAP